MPFEPPIKVVPIVAPKVDHGPATTEQQLAAWVEVARKRHPFLFHGRGMWAGRFRACYLGFAYIGATGKRAKYGEDVFLGLARKGVHVTDGLAAQIVRWNDIYGLSLDQISARLVGPR